jgi:hypothetical protein
MVIINSLCCCLLYLIINPGVHLKRFLPLDCRQFVPIFITRPVIMTAAQQGGRLFNFKLQPFILFKINQKCQLSTTVRTSASNFAQFKFDKRKPFLNMSHVCCHMVMFGSIE